MEILLYLRRAFARHSRTAPLCRGHRAYLCLERLEDRTLLSTVNWVNASGGNWNVGSNWSTGTVPGNGDAAVINTASAATITIQSSDTISVLSVTTAADDTLSIAGGTLTVTAGTSTLSGPLSMTGGALTAIGTGVSLTANGSTAAPEASLFARGGATLNLPQLSSYSSNGTFQADGTGSILNVSALTAVTQSQGGWDIAATNGGAIELNGMTTLTGTTGITITDTGGSTLLDPNVTSLSNVTADLDGSDAHVAESWTTFVNGTLTVTVGSYSLPGLTDVDESSLNVVEGGSLALGGLKSYASNGAFHADGTGSVLDVAALTTVTQPQGPWKIDASNGGTINLDGMTSLAGAQGITISDTGGSTLLDPNVTSLSNVTAGLDGSDIHVADSWTKFVNGTLTVTAGSYSLPGLTDVDGSSLNADNGGSQTLAGLKSYSSNGTFHADGAGSVLDVSALTTVTQPQGPWNIEASKGGTIKLNGMTSLTSTAGIDLTDTGGSTVVDPNVTSLTGVTADLDGSDAHVADSWTKFFAGTLTVTAGSYSLPGLTDVDQSSLNADNGGSLILGGLKSYSSNGTFHADGTGSVLDVSALTSVTQAHGTWNVEASTGGTVKLNGLTSLTATASITIADTGGSKVLDPNLTSLSGVTVMLDGTDPHVADSWATFVSASLTVNVGSYSLPGLTDVDESTLNADSGGSLTLGGLNSYSGDGEFHADGAGSVLDVAALTAVTQQGVWHIEATDGGTVHLNSLTSLTSTTSIVATNGGTVTLNSLASLSIAAGIGVTDIGGSTVLDPKLTSLTGVDVLLDGSDPQVGDAWITFTGGSMTLTSGVTTLPSLTDIGNPALFFSGGATLSLPVLTMGSITLSNGQSVTIQGTVVSIPADGINNGTLSIPASARLTVATTGDFTNDASLSIGAGSTLSVAGNFTEAGAGTLSVQIGGTPASGLFGQLAVTKAAALAGTLDVALANSFTPSAGQQFNVVTFASASGAFASFVGLSPDFTQALTATAQILMVPQAPAFTSADNTEFITGTAGTFTVAASGTPAPTLSESNTDVLPVGVTFTPATGTLAGTPAAGTAGTYILHFTAHNGAGSDATQTFTLVVTPPGFSYDGATMTLTITASAAVNTFTFAQATTEDASNTLHTTYSFTLNGVSDSFTNSQVAAVFVNGVATGTNTATLITNDTYVDNNGKPQETKETIALGSQTNAGVGTMLKYTADGTPFTFLTLSGFPVSYAYVGRNDGTVSLYSTAGVAYNGFVSAGNYSYIGGPGLYHEAQGATSVYGYSAGQPTDFAYQYSANAGSSFVVSGVAFSYMSCTDQNPDANNATQAYFNVGVGFLVNTGVSKNPGKDYAYIIDSPGNDTFVGGNAYSYMYIQNTGGTFAELDTAYAFALIYAESFVGGTDTAINGDPSKNILGGNWHVA